MIHPILLEFYSNNNLVIHYEIKQEFEVDFRIHLNNLKTAFSNKNIKRAYIEVHALFDLIIYLNENETMILYCERILNNTTNDIEFMDYVALMILFSNYQI